MINLFALVLVGFAAAQDSVPQTARMSLGEVHVFALAEPDLIALDWRGLTVGVEPPEVEIAGAQARPVFSLPYAEREGGLTAGVLIGGASAEELSWQITLARALSAALRGTGSEVVVYAGGEHVLELGVAGSDDEVALATLFDSLAEEAGRLAAPVDAASLSEMLALLDERASAPGQRLVVLAPGASFPGDGDALVRLERLSLEADAALFPITGLPDSGLEALAAATGGAQITRGFDADSAAMAALLEPAMSGGALAFELPFHRQYRLPGETARPLSLTVSADGAAQELVLIHEVPVLSGGRLALAFVDPRYWGNWLAMPERRVAGAGGLGLWSILLGSLALGARNLLRGRAAHEPFLPIEAPPGDISIGRRSSNRLVLSHASVSREHALLKQVGVGRYEISDLGSTNGTFLSRGGTWERLVAPVEIGAGDHVRFGEVSMSLSEILTAITGASAGGSDMARFNRPRRNPYTGQIEEGGS